MNGSDSLLDRSTSPEVAAGSFQIVRRGYDPLEVQAFARAVSAELQRLSQENQELRTRLRSAESQGPGTLDESSVAQYLGSETTRLLQAARDTAAGIVHRAEERAEQIVARSEDDARRLRDEGVADAAHERRVAADEARKLISDAAEQRRTVLGELARRRDLASNQLHELIRGRDVLVQALSNVAVSSNDLVTRLDSISVTPGDFVNLDPARSDADPGVDRGSVVRVDFAPPEPGTARAVRQAASSEPMASSGAVAPSAAGADDDGGPVLFTLDG